MYIINDKIHDKVVANAIQKVLNSDPDGHDLGSHIGIQQVATFADDMRANPDFDCIKNLHFTEIPLDVLSFKDFATANPKGDLVSAVTTLIEYLQTQNSAVLAKTPSLQTLDSNPRTKLTRELALKLLAHFIGDLYQPLHLGAAEDWGGNRIVVSLFNEETNLHSAIDGLLKERLDAKDFADDQEREITTAEFDETWKIELYAAADTTLALRKQLYVFPDGYKTVPQPNDANGVDQPPKQIPIIGPKYILANKSLLHQQIQKGGILLARALVQLFDPKFKQKSKFGFYELKTNPSCSQVMF
jgi:hypothetical protein